MGTIDPVPTDAAIGMGSKRSTPASGDRRARRDRRGRARRPARPSPYSPSRFHGSGDRSERATARSAIPHTFSPTLGVPASEPTSRRAAMEHHCFEGNIVDRNGPKRSAPTLQRGSSTGVDTLRGRFSGSATNGRDQSVQRRPKGAACSRRCELRGGVNGREAGSRVHDVKALPPPWTVREPGEKRVRARPARNRVLVSNLHEHPNTPGKGRQLRARYESRGEDGVHGSRLRQAPAARIGRVVEREARTVGVAGDNDGQAASGQPAECRLESTAERCNPRRPLGVAATLICREDNRAAVGDEMIEPRPKLAHPWIGRARWCHLPAVKEDHDAAGMRAR